jgi:hypothetical protein
MAECACLAYLALELQPVLVSSPSWRADTRFNIQHAECVAAAMEAHMAEVPAQCALSLGALRLSLNIVLFIVNQQDMTSERYRMRAAKRDRQVPINLPN